jgi:hypothetical protein
MLRLQAPLCPRLLLDSCLGNFLNISLDLEGDHLRVWIRKHSFPSGRAGGHTVRFWSRSPELVVEKIVVDYGGIRKSYLGPPESMRI